MTDKMAAASDDSNYAVYIYQENDLSLALRHCLGCRRAKTVTATTLNIP